MISSVDTVFFAIQAGVRLYGAARKAYADTTKDRQLILPLPKGAILDALSAKRWFLSDEIGKEVRQELTNDRIEFFLAIETDDLTPEESQEFIEIYSVLYNLHGGVVAAESGHGKSPFSTKELDAALSIRQWSKTAPADHATPLQTVAGTLVNIAVDYFVSTPGAVSEDRPEGKAIKAFLTSIDDTDFRDTRVADIAPGLFVALLDGISAHPDVLLGGPKEKEFVTKVTTSLSQSVKTALAGLTTLEQDKLLAGDWLQLIGRAFFKGGAEIVLAHSQTYLGARAGTEADVVSVLVSNFTEIVLTDAGVDIKRVISSEGLERLVNTALTAVAENPGILKLDGDRRGVEKTILELVTMLSRRNRIVSEDWLPDVARILLERTASNLDLVWGRRDSDAAANLLMIATKELLDGLAAGSDLDTWRPQPTHAQLLGLLETVLDEVIDNPGWVSEAVAGDDSNLRLTIDAALASLRKQDGARITVETAVRTLHAAVAAVAVNLSLIERLDAGHGKIALTALLDTVFAALLAPTLDAKTKWRLARNSALSLVVEVALDRLAKRPLTEHNILILGEEIGRLIAGETPLESLGDVIETRLTA